jgi:hypothetical protein
LPDDGEAEEAVAERSALVVSFETQSRDEAARQLMATERRAAADRLAVAQEATRVAAHRRNVEAAMRRWRSRDIVRKTSTHSPPTSPGRSTRRTDGHNCFLEDTEHRRELVRRSNSAAAGWLTDYVGSMAVLARRTLHRALTPSGEDSEDNVLF